MNSWNWQLAVTVPIVAWAVVVLVRRGASMLRESERSSCGETGCGSCPTNGSGAENSIVQLNLASGAVSTKSTEN